MKCQARTKTGKACNVPALTGQRFCFTHSPKVAKERAAAHRLGGERQRTPHSEAGKPPRKIRSLEDAGKLLDYGLAELLVHENSIARVSKIIALYTAFVQSIEVGEIEQRLSALEQRLKTE